MARWITGFHSSLVVPYFLRVSREESIPTQPVSVPKYFDHQIPKFSEHNLSQSWVKSQGVDSALQGNVCMEQGINAEHGLSLEGIRAKSIHLNPIMNGALNARVQKESDTLSPKYRKKSTGPTWKRAAGKTRAILHDVPILTITGSKRSNEAIMVDVTDWDTEGKRVRSDNGTSNFDESISAAAVTQPRRAP
ncbi:hypothetical protein FCV25MIE_00255 [Fagus crenata]